MADLKALKNKRLAAAAAVNAKPMPPARIPAPKPGIAAQVEEISPVKDEATTPAAATFQPLPERVEPDTEAVATPEPDRSAQTEPPSGVEAEKPPIAPPEPVPSASTPVGDVTPRNAPTIRKAVGQGGTSTRFTLTLQNPALAAEVESLARAHGFDVDQLLRRIALNTLIEDQDFEAAKAEPSKRRYEQGGIRQTLQYDPQKAAAWCRVVDPLSLATEAVTMRPVALKAFERAARSHIAAVNNGK